MDCVEKVFSNLDVSMIRNVLYGKIEKEDITWREIKKITREIKMSDGKKFWINDECGE